VLGAPLTDKAFPSGHAAGGSVAVVLIALLLGLTAAKPLVRRLVVIIGCLLALLIGWSRSYLGDHWPTDVLAGWFLAAAIVSVTMALVNQALINQTAQYPGDEMPEEVDPDASRKTLQPTISQERPHHTEIARRQQ
jgi:membrane-associated phospholipid phosphatase